jgi:hypothetical protein
VPLNPLLAGLVDGDDSDYDGPPPSTGDRDRALRALDVVEAAIARARAILTDGTIDRHPTGIALDAVRWSTDPLTEIAFEMHGMAG